MIVFRDASGIDRQMGMVGKAPYLVLLSLGEKRFSGEGAREVSWKTRRQVRPKLAPH